MSGQFDIDTVVATARKGDRLAEDQLFTLVNEQLRERIFSLVQQRIWSQYRTAEEIKKDAEDITQEIFLTIWRRYKTQDFRNGFMGWVYQVVRNKVGDYYRRMKFRRDIVVYTDDLTSLPMPDAMYVDTESQMVELDDLVQHTQAELNESEQAILEAFLEYEIKGYIRTHKKNTPIGTIYTRIHRCRKHLVELFLKHGQDYALPKPASC